MTTKPSILLVESDFAQRHPLAEYLRDCGYQVIEAVTSDEAVLILKDDSQAVDVVLSGVSNPGKLDAFALASWIRDHGSRTRVIMAATPAKAAAKATELCHEGPHTGGPHHTQGLLDRIRQLMAMRDRNLGGKPLTAAD